MVKMFKLILTILLIMTGCSNYDITNDFSMAENEKEFVKTESEENQNLHNTVLSLIDNETSADILIKNAYPDNVLQNMPNDLEDLFLEMPPECIRQAEDQNIVYFVYKSDNGNYAFLMYSLKSSAVLSKWYVGKPVFFENFVQMADRNANLSEVYEYDPYGSYSSFNLNYITSPFSCHNTVDGYSVRIDYNVEIGKPISISNITTLSGEENIYFN